MIPKATLAANATAALAIIFHFTGESSTFEIRDGGLFCPAYQ
jgi:hypothetical protein